MSSQESLYSNHIPQSVLHIQINSPISLIINKPQVMNLSKMKD